MTSIEIKRRKARKKRREVQPPHKRRYGNLIVAVPFIAFIGILIVIYGPFGGEGTATDFTLTDVHGRGTFTLSAHRGEVVVIEFFSTDCSSCHRYLFTLKQIRTLYSNEELTMISISVPRSHDTESSLRVYAIENGITWYIALDTSFVTDEYQVRFTPTTVIVDKNGDIALQQSGILSSTFLQSKIDSLL
ncbi:MAG: TlpA family protein disulfide reductase [Candidatus Heimdallarchaeota archaeon]